MTCSPAQLAANQANARKSTGPRSESGKARSRCNSLKHGLTGAGVVVPEADLAEVERRAAGFGAELRPTGDLGRYLVRHAAVLSLRIDRCAYHELAETARRQVGALDAHDEAALQEAQFHLGRIGEEPAACVRRLLRTPEGIDALADAFGSLRAILLDPDPAHWKPEHHDRIGHLMGRRPTDFPRSLTLPLCRAASGDFAMLGPGEGAGPLDADRIAWARTRLVEMIDQELAALRQVRESLDFEAIELVRAGAPDRALFDPSREADRARRYEAAAARDFFKALREIRQSEAAAPAPTPAPAPPPARSVPPTPAPAPTAPSPKSGSFCPAPIPAPTPARPMVQPAVYGPPDVPMSIGIAPVGARGGPIR